MKICTRCGASLPFSEFHRNSKRTDQLQPYCKACNSLAGKAWYQANKERAADATMARKYGLPPGQYDAMVRLQEGRCSCCAQPSRKLYVDHCHITLAIRSLLCHRCNVFVGFLEREPRTCGWAADYIELHGGAQ